METSVIFRGDILLITFPFTDLSSRKVRPATVISADPQNRDLILAFISSSIPRRPLRNSEVLILDSDSNFKHTKLKESSVFKMDKLCTLEQTLAQRKLGKVTPNLQLKLDEALKYALSL